MAELKVCVSLESTTVDEMVDEAARANLSGADMVEIRFDRLWLDKPEPEIVEDENGRTREVMSLENTWAVNDLEHVEIDAALDRLVEGIQAEAMFTVRPRPGRIFPWNGRAAHRHPRFSPRPRHSVG